MLTNIYIYIWHRLWPRYYFEFNCNKPDIVILPDFPCARGITRCVKLLENVLNTENECVGSQIDSFTVPLHSPHGSHLPAVRAAQRDCHWGLKNGGNSHRSREPIMQWGTRQSQSIFRPASHKRVIPANWRPCLLPH